MTDTETLTVALDTTILDAAFWPEGSTRTGGGRKSGQWDADMAALIAKGYNDAGTSATVVTKGIPADFATNDASKRLLRTMRQSLAHTAARLTSTITDGKPVKGTAAKSLDSKVIVANETTAPALGVDPGTAVMVWRLIPRREQPAGLAQAAPTTETAAKPPKASKS